MTRALQCLAHVTAEHNGQCSWLKRYLVSVQGRTPAVLALRIVVLHLPAACLYIHHVNESTAGSPQWRFHEEIGVLTLLFKALTLLPSSEAVCAATDVAAVTADLLSANAGAWRVPFRRPGVRGAKPLSDNIGRSVRALAHHRGRQ